MDRYDSNIANRKISEQEHIRPNPNMFNSSLTIPIYSYHTQSNLKGNSGHIKIYSTLRTKILEYLQNTLMITKKLFTLTD